MVEYYDQVPPGKIIDCSMSIKFEKSVCVRFPKWGSRKNYMSINMFNMFNALLKYFSKMVSAKAVKIVFAFDF